MNRVCPVCTGSHREEIYSFILLSGLTQNLYQCLCGMIYASVIIPVDYETDPIYSFKGATGSGQTSYDKERLAYTANYISNFIPLQANVADVGCAQGGLLDQLAVKGYTHLVGFELSKECSKIARSKGHNIYNQGLGNPGGYDNLKYDMITLSHVLEHIVDTRTMLFNIYNSLVPFGLVYIEVPDVNRYLKYGLAFLDFNNEHINHFSSATLTAAVNQSGFTVLDLNRKVIKLTNGMEYPAISVLARKKTNEHPIKEYITKATHTMYLANNKLEEQLSKDKEVIIWGAGEYLCHIAALPVFKRIKIVQLIDRNSVLHGKKVYGIEIEHPDKIRKDIPIVIAAIVAAKSIRADIIQRQLSNKVVSPME